MLRCFLLLFLSIQAFSHQSKENYLHLDYNSSSLYLNFTAQIETKNFQELFQLDDNHNEIISYKELTHHKDLLKNYIQKSLRVYLDTKLQTLSSGEISFQRLQDQTYMYITGGFPLDSLNKLCIQHHLFLEIDTQQKLFIRLKKPPLEMILSDSKREYCLQDSALTSWQRFILFLQEGIEHILSGYDHLLFLLMLILPLIVLKHPSKYHEFISFLKVITAFTLAHSITLFFSATRIYQPSVILIESSIALSIMIVSLLNLLKYFKQVDYKISFAFGLLHGFGFANVLHMGKVTDKIDFALALFGFNLGVEIGQLIMILIMFLILWLVMRTSSYPRVFQLLSLLSFCLAGYWFLQRVFLI